MGSAIHLKINVRARIQEQAAGEIKRGTVTPYYAMYWYHQTFAADKRWKRLVKAERTPGCINLLHRQDYQ